MSADFPRSALEILHRVFGYTAFRGHQNEIVVSVRRVADIMGEISLASQDQSQGIDQINQAMGQMDQVTQSNAALVEEAAAAAQSLEHQAQGLVHAVSVFKTGSGAQPLALAAR